jgi:hypothetical protein
MSNEKDGAPILALIAMNPQDGRLGISYGPGISDRKAFLVGLNQLVAQELMENLIEELTEKKRPQIEVARGPIPNLRVKQ